MPDFWAEVGGGMASEAASGVAKGTYNKAGKREKRKIRLGVRAAWTTRLRRCMSCMFRADAAYVCALPVSPLPPLLNSYPHRLSCVRSFSLLPLLYPISLLFSFLSSVFLPILSAASYIPLRVALGAAFAASRIRGAFMEVFSCGGR